MCVASTCVRAKSTKSTKTLLVAPRIVVNYDPAYFGGGTRLTVLGKKRTVCVSVLGFGLMSFFVLLAEAASRRRASKPQKKESNLNFKIDL